MSSTKHLRFGSVGRLINLLGSNFCAFSSFKAIVSGVSKGLAMPSFEAAPTPVFFTVVDVLPTPPFSELVAAEDEPEVVFFVDLAALRDSRAFNFSCFFNAFACSRFMMFSFSRSISLLITKAFSSSLSSNDF